MDAKVSAVLLAAKVSAVLLAATVDLSQRWQFLTPEDRVDAVTDLITLLYVYNRAFTDEATTSETLAQTVGKALSDQSYLVDQAALAVGLQTDAVLAAIDDYFRTVAYARTYVDNILPADAAAIEPQLARTESLSTTDAAAKSVSPGYAETCNPTDAAALSFAAQIQELVASVESFARTVDFARSVAESTPIADAPAKTFTTAFSDVGDLYAAVGYFADDYVVAGTGPAVYDTFSYTLA